jgi:hypothetical protein
VPEADLVQTIISQEFEMPGAAAEGGDRVGMSRLWPQAGGQAQPGYVVDHPIVPVLWTSAAGTFRP